MIEVRYKRLGPFEPVLGSINRELPSMPITYH